MSSIRCGLWSEAREAWAASPIEPSWLLLRLGAHALTCSRRVCSDLASLHGLAIWLALMRRCELDLLLQLPHGRLLDRQGLAQPLDLVGGLVEPANEILLTHVPVSRCVISQKVDDILAHAGFFHGICGSSHTSSGVSAASRISMPSTGSPSCTPNS